jgi:hypothetical protein
MIFQECPGLPPCRKRRGRRPCRKPPAGPQEGSSLHRPDLMNVFAFFGKRERVGERTSVVGRRPGRPPQVIVKSRINIDRSPRSLWAAEDCLVETFFPPSKATSYRNVAGPGGRLVPSRVGSRRVTVSARRGYRTGSARTRPAPAMVFPPRPDRAARRTRKGQFSAGDETGLQACRLRINGCCLRL